MYRILKKFVKRMEKELEKVLGEFNILIIIICSIYLVHSTIIKSYCSREVKSIYVLIR